MKWKLLAVIAGFALFVGLRVGWMAAHQHADIRAVDGVMDLRDWDAGAGRLVPLQGEWAFYPGQLLQPGEEDAASGRSRIVVPGGWDSHFAGAFGAGTYRLDIRLPDLPAGDNRKFAIRASIVRTAFRLYVNGELIGGQGTPGLTKETSVPRVMPLTADFRAEGDRITLLLQASNFDYARNGGILQTVYFGSADAMDMREVLNTGRNAMLMGTFVICAIIFFLLYFFRRKNREMLYFSLFQWCSLLFWLTHNERMLFMLVPEIPYDWHPRLQSLPSAVLFFSLLMFVRWMYPDHVDRRLIRAAAIGTAGFTCLYLFGNLDMVTGSEMYLMAFDLLMTVYACWILVREVLQQRADAVYTLIGAFCIIYEGIFQGLYYLGFDTIEVFPPVEKLLFALIMGLIIAKRFFYGLREVEKLSGQLLVADRLKNDFLATTSSELRLPLHGMINIAEVMLHDDDLGERQAERLRLLLASGRRLIHLLGDILDLSKINEGGLELRKGPVDARMLVSGVTEVMRYLKDNRAVRFENRILAGVPAVSADEHRLMQTLFHLLHFSTKWGAHGLILITAEKRHDSDSLMLTIAAKRPGMPEAADETARVTAAAEDFSLEIGRKLLRLHGSELQVEETETSLRIAFGLPVCMPEPGEETAAAREQGRPDEAAVNTDLPTAAVLRHAVPHAPRVLIVEDDTVSLRVMFDILAQDNLDVTALTDGQEALKLLERESGWDLVVLETILPEMSGYELCRKIRERHSFYDLPVLFLTAGNQPAYLLMGFDAGANDYVTKPLHTPEFLARTRILLRMKQAMQERLDIEMALIQAQIKPHFLHNTLNTIAGLSEVDPDGTRDLLAEFGNYLHHSFDLRNLDRHVPFEKEWTLVQSYLNIEQARFGHRLEVSVSLPETCDFELPPLTLQPIVENAIRHGVLKRIEGGRIRIAVTYDALAAQYRVAVHDTGVGFSLTRRSAILDGSYRGGIGLMNVNRRLLNAYGRGLSIETEEGEWTEVSFEIPANTPRSKEEPA